MIRMLLTKLGLLTGLCWFLCFSVYSQPKNPRYWYIPDSIVIQFNENGDTIIDSEIVPIKIHSNLWSEPSSCVELSTCLLVGNSEEIALFDKKTLQKLDSTFFYRIHFPEENTFTISQGLLFVNNNGSIHVFFGIFNGGKISWGHSILKVQNNQILIFKQPYMLLMGENAEKCTVIRHANGRDWWVFFQSFGAGTGAPYQMYLLTDDLVYFAKTQSTDNQNDNLYYGTIGQSSFSNDGKHFAAAQQTGQLHLFNFQRQNGLLINQKTFWFNPQPYGVAFVDSYLVFTLYRTNPSKGLTFSLNVNTLQTVLLDSIGGDFDIDSQFIFLSTMSNSVIATRYGTKFISRLANINFFVPFSHPLKKNSLGTLPNLPNYELGPDLNPGFSTNLPDTVLCVGQTFTVTDTSWGHFRRMWEWGDGTFSDTFAVKQHWELLGLLDTFRTFSHTFAQPGTYNLTLHIINDSSEFGYMDSTVTKTFVVLPWCQTPVIQAHADSICLVQMALSASGDSATYTWTFTNGTASGTQISHFFSQSGWNVFSLNVNKFGIDTTLIDSVFVKDCISADFQTEMIPFCDSVIVKVYPQVSKGQIDKVTASFQNQSISCLDSCSFTVLENAEENLMLSFENSTDDTSIVKNLKINLLDCPEFIEIYPNPVTDQLQIHFRLEKPENLRLCNALGQDVLHLKLEGNGIYTVDVNALSRGFYHLRLERHPDKKRGLKERWKLVLE